MGCGQGRGEGTPVHAVGEGARRPGGGKARGGGGGKVKGPGRVGEPSPTPFGFLDRGENVHGGWWVWFCKDYYADSRERNPWGPAAGDRRASRGGSWRHHIKATRCAARSSIPPAFQYADYGFRVVCVRQE